MENDQIEKNRIQSIWNINMEQARLMSVMLSLNGLDSVKFFKLCAKNASKGQKAMIKQAQEMGQAAPKH